MRIAVASLFKLIVVFILLHVGVFSSYAQSQLNGVLVDNLTEKPIQGATVKVENTNQILSSNNEGKFSIKLNTGNKFLSIHALGYKIKRLSVDSLLNQDVFVIRLDSLSQVLDAIEIVAKTKYNRKNPATELIDLVIQHKSKNKLTRKDSLYYEQYDKVKFGLLNPPERLGRGLGDLNFFFKNLDTSLYEGKKALTLYLQEDISDNYVKQDPARTKRIVKHQIKTELDSRYVNNPNIQSGVNYLFQEIDLYDESLFFINKMFLSPIADNAKLYYKFFIVDTTKTSNDTFIKLRFEPFNKEDLLFSGELYITMDGKFAVKSATLSVGKEANLNWVNNLNIELSYTKNAEGFMLKESTKTFITFGGKNDAMFGERISYNQNYKKSQTFDSDIFIGAPIEYRLKDWGKDTIKRPIPLSIYEQNTYNNMATLNEKASFKKLLAVGYLLSQGYYSLGKFELGPVENLLFLNDFEGQRFRVGGRSTPLLSEKVYLEGYLAYGTRDQRFKYYLSSAVSLNGKPVTTFPAHYLEGSVQHDLFEVGKSLGFLKGDSFFRSFRSNKTTKWLNTDAYKLGHVVEFGNHFSVSTHFTHQRRNTIGDFKLLLSADSSTLLRNINTNDAQIVLRWAPMEKFYYRNMTRTTIKEKYPVFNLQYNHGFKGMGANYSYDALRFSATKRFFLNQLGFADATWSVGKIWGTLPYTLLEVPNIQEKKDRHSISYERTEEMEFVADQFMKFSYEHELNGFILNKIPLIKKFRLREIFGANMFWGKLSDHNNPFKSKDVVYFDHDKQGETMTRVLGTNPYWEGYVGLDNLFRIVRLQYFMRMNYNYVKAPIGEKLRVNLYFNF